MKVLILGSSGSGKTHLSLILKKYGLDTVDADSIRELHGWYDGKANKVKFPKDAGKEFFDNNSFLWDREILISYLAKNPDIYLFGMSGNVFDMIDLFDRIYFLDVPENVIKKRLQHLSRANPMGKTSYQQKVVIEWAKLLKEKAKKLGLTFVDATLTPEKVYKLITDID